MSSPDWWVRDVTRPKGGGARSGEGGGTSLQRAWTERVQDCRSKRESYEESAWVLLRVLVRIVETGVWLWKDHVRVFVRIARD